MRCGCSSGAAGDGRTRGWCRDTDGRAGCTADSTASGWFTDPDPDPDPEYEYSPHRAAERRVNMGSASSSYRVIYLDVDGRIQKVRLMAVWKLLEDKINTNKISQMEKCV